MPYEDEIADALSSIAVHLKYLGNGDATTTMGAIEHHSVQVKEGALRVAEALDGVGESLSSIAVNLDLLTDAVSEGLQDIAKSLRASSP